MAGKRALIVDDSRTAQIRLKKMLQKYQLEVDTADSAEEALGYLSYQMPSVIFMDHLMQGMDGFEALKIIKSNPDTAMIPIIMYTSKSGDVYVGQARALGAIDVLSKDVIEPANIENVLRGIGILTPAGKPMAKRPEPEVAVNSESTQPVPMEEIPARTGGRPYTPEPAGDSGLQAIRQQVAKLMEINIAKIRQELADQNRFLFRRMVREFKDVKSLQQEANLSTIQFTAPEPEVVQREGSWRTLLLQFLIIIVLGFIGYQVIGLNSLQQQYSVQLLELQSQIDKQLVVSRELQNTQAAQMAGDLVQQQEQWLAAVEWSLNLRNQFSFGEQALSDGRLATVQELVARLHEADFAGVVMLSVHFGDFCLLPTARGDFRFPKPDSSLQSCQMLSDTTKVFSLQEQTSVNFVNFLISSPLLAEQGIQIDMRADGYSVPRFEYPEPTASAGEWNRIASLNNRVEISLIPYRQNNY